MKKIIIGVIIVLLVIIAIFLGRTKTIDETITTIPLENGLVIKELKNTSGCFWEDGSNSNVQSVASFVLENNSERTLQLLELQILIDDEKYDFQITTVPPQEKVFVQEINKKSFPSTYTEVSVDAKYTVFFQQEPSLKEDVIEITEENNMLVAENISMSDINGPIYIYYKNVGENGEYIGGITYRVLIEKLSQGEQFSVMANHYEVNNSKVMFVEYAQ